MIFYYRAFVNNAKVILALSIPCPTAARTNCCCIRGECMEEVRSEPGWGAEAGLKADVHKFIPARTRSCISVLEGQEWWAGAL